MKKTLLIFYLFSPLWTAAQLSPEIERLFLEANKTDLETSPHLGYSGITNPVFGIYAEIKEKATAAELYYMATHGNRYTKSSMAAALVNLKSDKLSDLFTHFLHQNDPIYIKTGCMGYDSTLLAELYSELFYQKNWLAEIANFKANYSEEEKSEYQKSQALYGKDQYPDHTSVWNITEIDSLLNIFRNRAIAYENIDSVSASLIMSMSHYKFENYSRIRFLANKYPTPELMAALAHFQRKEDLDLFTDHFDDAFLAVEKFPHESFIPLLKQKFSNRIDDSRFLKATAAYRNRKIFPVLDILFANLTFSIRKSDIGTSDIELLDIIYNSMESAQCRDFDTYLKKVWEVHKVISFTYFQKLTAKGAYKSLLKGFRNPQKLIKAISDSEHCAIAYTEDALFGELCPQILESLQKKYSKEPGLLPDCNGEY